MLREAFDRAFAEPPAVERRESLDLLSIRLGGDPFALRLAETAGLFSDRKITPVPTPLRELRGVAGVRGALVPVYDLAAVMGYPPTTTARWLVIAREAPVAFAFDIFEGQLRIDSSGLIAHEASGREHVRQVARAADLSRPVVDLPSVIAAIGKRSSDTVSRREA
jgi:purine-binding chemotaxis protein CheW